MRIIDIKEPSDLKRIRADIIASDGTTTEYRAPDMVLALMIVIADLWERVEELEQNAEGR